MNGRAWTKPETAKLRRLYPDHTAAQVAQVLGRATSTVHRKANELGIRKSAAFLASAQSGRVQRGKQHPSMVASQFKKGIVPWNKGSHYVAGGRSAETRFKPGQVSIRWDPEIFCVGALRVTSDGNLEIKLAEGARQWKTLSHYVWFLETGAWPPKRHVLRARNGDNHDTRIENLELLTTSENMRRNSYHTHYPPEVRRLVQLKGAITRQVNRINREATA